MNLLNPRNPRNPETPADACASPSTRASCPSRPTRPRCGVVAGFRLKYKPLLPYCLSAFTVLHDTVHVMLFEQCAWSISKEKVHWRCGQGAESAGSRGSYGSPAPRPVLFPPHASTVDDRKHAQSHAPRVHCERMESACRRTPRKRHAREAGAHHVGWARMHGGI